MKPRELVEIVRPDHVPVLAVQSQPDLRNQSQQVTLRCSCGYEVSLMQNIDFAFEHPEVSAALREQWIYREMHEHLLDQDVDMSEIDP